MTEIRKITCIENDIRKVTVKAGEIIEIDVEKPRKMMLSDALCESAYSHAIITRGKKMAYAWTEDGVKAMFRGEIVSDVMTFSIIDITADDWICMTQEEYTATYAEPADEVSGSVDTGFYADAYSCGIREPICEDVPENEAGCAAEAEPRPVAFPTE